MGDKNREFQDTNNFVSTEQQRMNELELEHMKSLLSNFEALLRKRTKEYDDMKKMYEMEKGFLESKNKECEYLEEEIQYWMKKSEFLAPELADKSTYQQKESMESLLESPEKMQLSEAYISRNDS